MNNRLQVQRQIVFNINYLMLCFLILSTFANLYLQRIEFVYLYLMGLIILLVHMYLFHKKRDVEEAANILMAFLFFIFFSFFFIGNQETFDILWVLVLPTVSIILNDYKQLRFFLSTYLLTLFIIGFLSELNNGFIPYESFAFWSLVWAAIFLCGMTIYYKKTQLELEDEITNYQNSLETRITEAVKEIKFLNEDLESTQFEIIERLGTLGEYRSEETGAHVIRVGLYAKELALLYGLDEKTAITIQKAAPLHDIGKVGIPDSILHKPAKLSKEEFEVMKKHTSIGEKVLAASKKPLIQMASKIAAYHHEKWDGSGYPNKLKMIEIPIEARIVAIADVFDALISKRSYKEPWRQEEIVTFFQENSGKHFDPNLVKLLLANFQNFVKIFKDNID